MKLLSILVLSTLLNTQSYAQYNTIEVGEPAPDAKVQRMEADGSNREVSLLDRPAGKLLLIEFSSSWCPPCNKNLPLFDEVAQKAKATTVAKYVLADEQAPEAWVKEKRDAGLLKYDVIWDPEFLNLEGYKIPGTPTTVVIDANNKILKTHIGAMSEADKAELLKTLGVQ